MTVGERKKIVNRIIWLFEEAVDCAQYVKKNPSDKEKQYAKGQLKQINSEIKFLNLLIKNYKIT